MRHSAQKAGPDPEAGFGKPALFVCAGRGPGCAFVLGHGVSRERKEGGEERKRKRGERGTKRLIKRERDSWERESRERVQ